jgi:hypothetical protein
MAAAVLFLAGCGGDDDGDSSASSSSSTSSSSSSSSAESSEDSGGDDELAAFCSEAEDSIASLSELQSNTDPAQIAPQLSEAADSFEAVEPPAEIADDWSTLGDALRNWADVSSAVDLATPEGQTQFQEATQQFVSTFTGPAGQAVDEFGSTNCA